MKEGTLAARSRKISKGLTQEVAQTSSNLVQANLPFITNVSMGHFVEFPLDMPNVAFNVPMILPFSLCHYVTGSSITISSKPLMLSPDGT